MELRGLQTNTQAQAHSDGSATRHKAAETSPQQSNSKEKTGKKIIPFNSNNNSNTSNKTAPKLTQSPILSVSKPRTKQSKAIVKNTQQSKEDSDFDDLFGDDDEESQRPAPVKKPAISIEDSDSDDLNGSDTDEDDIPPPHYDNFEEEEEEEDDAQVTPPIDED